jgi:hypothetical protein
MNTGHRFNKYLSIFLIVALVSFAPVSSLQKASEAADLNKLLIGGALGAAGLVAIGALAGPAATIGAVGAAGTGIVGALGGTLGTIVSGVTAVAASMGKLTMSSMATLGLMVGGAAIGIAGLLGTGFALVPAAVLGGGLLAYFMSRSKYRYGTPYDQRYSGPLHDPFFNAGSRQANSTEQSWSDKIRSIFDRDRRDDQFFTDNRYVDNDGYIRRGTDVMSQIDRFFNGSNSGYAGGDPTRTNSLYTGRTVYGGSVASTDRSGRIVGYNDYRGGITAPRAAESTEAVAENTSSEDTETTLSNAKAAREEAYRNLVKAMSETKSGDSDVPATLNSSLMDETVQAALNEYKAADKLVKELTGRLQHLEKQ